MTEAKGVTMKMPSQVVAANSPATVVETWACLSSNNNNKGDSMKMPDSWNSVEPKTLSKPCRKVYPADCSASPACSRSGWKWILGKRSCARRTS